MSRKILLLATLTAMATYGQGQSVNQPANQPANTAYGAPITTTPIATFTTPAPTAGISDAGRAGISVNTNTAAQEEVAPGVSSEPVSIAPAPTEISPAENIPTNDLGASGSVNDAVVAAPLGVAEAASRFKTAKTTLNARVLSNEDVQAIVNGKGGVTTAGVAAGSGSAAQNGNGDASAIGSQAGSQIATQSTAVQPANEQNNPQQPAASETNADNATTPQINQNQQSNDAQGATRLPATSTFLPLLGLVGLASSGFGLWFRRFRK